MEQRALIVVCGGKRSGAALTDFYLSRECWLRTDKFEKKPFAARTGKINWLFEYSNENAGSNDDKNLLYRYKKSIK